MLSQTSEHALRAVLFLAQRPEGQPAAAESISDALGAPRNYLAKTLQALARRGIVASMRGPSGGFWLNVPADRLTLAEVIEAFEEPRTRGVCLMGGKPCHDEKPCSVHFRWKAVSQDAWAPLRDTTIAHLLGHSLPDLDIAGALSGRPCQATGSA
jgi:Rrf2 family transcriptional regulator, iron-sulfur cluster assembly transcription factor